MGVDLRNKVACITGASRGIGRSISLALAEAGAHVVLISRNLNKLKDVESEIVSSGGKALVVQADLAEEKEIVSAFNEIKSRIKKLDILIGNAGIGKAGKLIDFSIEDFDKIMAVNLRGAYICCQEAMRIMIPQRSGYIISISSVVGFRGYANQSAYSASKHGQMGFIKALAAEAQEYGIRVSAILPGVVDTEFGKAIRPDLDKSVLIPPDDIARTVLYLLSLSEQAMVDQVYVRRMASSPF
ncbi:MAG: SDR family oxidoreductase [Spirochaetota bacterium]|nr:MAG: SDR family oxidoreductase [Spirochaetota bacterium]